MVNQVDDILTKATARNLILKVKKFQLSGPERFGTVEENLHWGWIPPPCHLGFHPHTI